MNSVFAEVNIGGQVFRSSVTSLRRSGLFAALFDHVLTDELKDSEGRIYLDRDPEIFNEVLRLLRGYHPRQLPDGRVPWSTLKPEAEFYKVPVELLTPPVEVALPPDILTLRRLYVDACSTEALRRDEICMYSLKDLPPDLKTQIRIVAVEVVRHQGGSKTVFVISQQVLEEAGFREHSEDVWERIERRCYHRVTGGVDLIIPQHPMEINREHCEYFVCVSYAVPPMGPVVTAGGQVVGVLRNPR